MRQQTRSNPKARDALSAGLLLCGLLSGCVVTPPAIRDLPELPAEYARDLALARTAPVLQTKSTTVATAPQPSSTGPIFANARACTDLYDGYVIYPMTVCYPPNELYETLVVGAIEAPAPNQKVPVPPTRYFKLSSHPLARIGGPWFCTVRSGPWYAHVEGAQLCNVNPNIRVFRADIISAPEAVVVNWTGALTDVPPPLNLFGISPSGESCVCCSGVMCPNGSCSTDLQHCGVGPPALK